MKLSGIEQIGKIARFVGVIGPGEEIDHRTHDLAEQVGYLVVDRCAAAVVCGGLMGVMKAAAGGAQRAGGVSIGILPDADRSRAYEQLTIALPSGVGELRDGLVVNFSDVIISVGGSWGTTAEIGLALRQAKRVISLDGWKILDSSSRQLPNGPIHVNSPDEAFEVLASLQIWGKS